MNVRFRPTTLLLLCVTAGLLAVLAPVAAQGTDATAGERLFGGFTEAEVEAMTPTSPNPYLSFLSSAAPDYRYWRARTALDAYRRAERRGEIAPPARRLDFEEIEPDGTAGQNDTYATAEFVAGFGTGPEDLDPVVTITGGLSTSLHDPDVDAFRDIEVFRDVDVFAFDLEAGDVLGVGESRGPIGVIQIFAPDGSLMVSASRPASAAYPEASPLPSEGLANKGAAVVAHEAGRYAVAVRSTGSGGAYAFGVHAFRPRTETEPGATQVLFVDFDGATLNAEEIFGDGNAEAGLSPLAAFLANWGFEPTDEDALIDRVMAVLEENLVDDLQERSNNPNTGVILQNSRDHADPGAAPYVSRLIVGGTVEELGINVLGRASAIDPGNFGLEDVGVVLLDALSSPPMLDGFSSSTWSLNAIELAPGAEKLDLVATTVGNIAAHEAGHFLGLWHTDAHSPVPTIQDEGGPASLEHMTGIGPDRVFGTADDIDADFLTDRYAPSELFVGVAYQLNTVAFGLTESAPVAADPAQPDAAAIAPLYPNPLAAGGVATLEVRTASEEEVRVGIYDVAGRLVRTAFEGPVAPGQPAFVRIAGHGLAAGAYLVRVEGAHASAVRRLTVVR